MKIYKYHNKVGSINITKLRISMFQIIISLNCFILVVGADEKQWSSEDSWWRQTEHDWYLWEKVSITWRWKY